MLDEMAIKKRFSWYDKQFCGYIDIGNGMSGVDLAPLAKDALVLMAV